MFKKNVQTNIFLFRVLPEIINRYFIDLRVCLCKYFPKSIRYYAPRVSFERPNKTCIANECCFFYPRYYNNFKAKNL